MPRTKRWPTRDGFFDELTSGFDGPVPAPAAKRCHPLVQRIAAVATGECAVEVEAAEPVEAVVAEAARGAAADGEVAVGERVQADGAAQPGA